VLLGARSAAEFHCQKVAETVEPWKGRQKIGARLPANLRGLAPLFLQFRAQAAYDGLTVYKVTHRHRRERTKSEKHNPRRDFAQVCRVGKDRWVHQESDTNCQNDNHGVCQYPRLQFAPV
jgi:hypothetical protein